MTAMVKKVAIIHRALWTAFFRVTIISEVATAATASTMNMTSFNPRASISQAFLKERSFSFVSRKSARVSRTYS